MLLTSQQALDRYHTAYQNEAYRTVCDDLTALLVAGTDLTLAAAQNTPDYITLSNLITDAALEVCGHPDQHGAGWTLTTSLIAVVEPRLQAGDLTHNDLRNFIRLLDGYFGIYRAHLREFAAQLDTQSISKTACQLATAQVVTDDAIRTASTIPSWRGRAAYHLISAAGGILRTAAEMR